MKINQYYSLTPLLFETSDEAGGFSHPPGTLPRNRNPIGIEPDQIIERYERNPSKHLLARRRLTPCLHPSASRQSAGGTGELRQIHQTHQRRVGGNQSE